MSYPKIIDIGGIRVTVESAAEEMRWVRPVVADTAVTRSVIAEPETVGASEPIALVTSETSSESPVTTDETPKKKVKKKHGKH